MAAPLNIFKAFESVPYGPCRAALAVTPHDTNPLTFVTRFIYVGGAGNVTVITEAGDTVTFTAPPVGTFIPICATHVKATGTTATLLIAMG